MSERHPSGVAPWRGPVLVCFAVREEAKYFSTAHLGQTQAEILVTGIAARNAAAVVRGRLSQGKPRLVLTCGFAGALVSHLRPGAVIYSADEGTPVGPALSALGAVPVSFHCAPRVASSAAEKRRLAAETGCAAVEMESGVIRTICYEQNIPSATVRVISDGADEDLPLNFNALMTPEWRIDFAKLAGRLIRSPGKIVALLRFQRQTQTAARELANTLSELLRRLPVIALL
jgi:uridine phosphorylase